MTHFIREPVLNRTVLGLYAFGMFLDPLAEVNP